MEECGAPSPPSALYKGAGLELDRPARPIKTQKARGAGTDPPPQPTTARFPASTARHLERMEGTWRTCRTEGTGEATSPHPVIVGSGRLADRASAPSNQRATPPHLPPFMGKARAASFHIYCDVTHACGNRPTHAAHVTHAPPPRVARAGRGRRSARKFYRGKNHPACLRTVLGLAQQRVALMCGPGPGAPVGVQKEGYTFCTPMTMHGQSEPRAPPHQARQGR